MSFRGSDSEDEEIELRGSDEDSTISFLPSEIQRNAAEKRKRRKVVLTAASVVAFLALIGVVVALATINRAVVASQVKENLPVGLDSIANATLSRMNMAQDPCVDFYEYACGGWAASHQIPPDRTAWGPYHELIEKTRKNTEAILQGDWPILTPFWKSCMDTAAVEQIGFGPLNRTLLDIEILISSSKDEAPTRVAEMLADFAFKGVSAIFDAYFDLDSKNPSEMVVTLAQGGTTVRMIEFYNDDMYREKRSRYVEHIEQVLALAGHSGNLTQIAQSVMALETHLANNSLPAAQRRDPEMGYNIYTMAQLRHLTEGRFDWERYFDLIGVPKPLQDRVVVRDPKFYSALPLFFQKYNHDTLGILGAYLKFRLTMSFAQYLPEVVRNQSFAISKLIYGVQQAPPREKFCSSVIDSQLGELIGRLYVLSHFPESSAQKARSIIEKVEHSFEAAMNLTSPWLDGPTASLAVEKLRSIINKVGYPDKWTDYSEITVSKNDILSNVLATLKFSFSNEIKLLNGSVTRSLWFMNPHTVNAYYNPSWNEIAITAGILQPPFFHADWPDALNYGSIGTVIGHELTHGFDDKGRKYDKNGVLQRWWPEYVVAAYTEKAKCFEKVYSSYGIKVENETLHVDGSLTLGENIADCGGLKHAFYAWKSLYNSKSFEEQQRDQIIAKQIFKLGNADQLFFVGFAQRDCELARASALRVQLATDPHSPGYARVVGPVSNFDEFGKTFGCPLGSPMNPADKCTLW